MRRAKPAPNAELASGPSSRPEAAGGALGGAPPVLGRYRIGERIGSGGTAEVYRAEVEGAAGFAKTLVVKCLRPALADEAELVEGLAREARLAQRLHHGNIVQVLDFGAEGGRPYVVMEHVDGCSLHELHADLRRRGERMGLPEALFVVEEVAAALRYVHGLSDDDGMPLRLVHRDVKPRNVLVSREGVVKLADFGIAKREGDRGDTLPGVIKGTPAWLAPEQARGRPVDARTDVYALGLLLRTLVGDDGEDETEPRPEPRPEPRVDEALRAVWRRATAEAPEDRFPDVSSMLRALQRWRAAHELDAGPGKLAAWVRRARRLAPAAEPRALDAALLGAGERDVTLASAARASTPVIDRAPKSRRRWPALAVALGLVGAASVVWRAEPLAERAAKAPRPSEPARPHEEAPASAPPDTPLAPAPRASRAATGPALPSPDPAAFAPSPDLGATSDPGSPAPTARDPAPVRRRDRPRAVEPGRLQVNVLPWAEVSVDGRSLGGVPVDVELAPGRHRVRLSNPQLGERTLEIEVPAGGVHKISRW